MSFVSRIAALLGISTYERAPSGALSLDDAQVEKARERFGGQLSPMPQTRLRWYLADLEGAMAEADVGLLNDAAQLWRAILARRPADGVAVLYLARIEGHAAHGVPEDWDGTFDLDTK